jgi:hypothetical protein
MSISKECTKRLLLAAMALGLACGCGTEEEDEGDECTVPLDTSYDPVIDPANFVTTIDNQFFPLPVGKTWTYKEGSADVVVTVKPDTKTILGVPCVVVQDTVSIAGEVIEDTFDWYTQDKDGTVWYFGEDTTEYVKGEAPSKEGSWEAGVDGAKPGKIMPGTPSVGLKFRQEYYSCHAEDEAEILSVSEAVTVRTALSPAASKLTTSPSSTPR